MSNLILKEKMRQIITQGMSIAPQTVYQSLNVYQENFGADDFFNNAAIAFSQQGPLVSLICLNCSNNDIDEFLSRQLYANLEIVSTTYEDSFVDITNYISSTQSKYICFYEPNHYYESSKIFDMVYTLERHQSVDILITARKFIDSEGTVIAPSEPLYCELENNNVINGTLLLQYSINENKNLFGNLSTLWLLLSMHKKSP